MGKPSQAAPTALASGAPAPDRAARSGGAHTWPPCPGARAGRGGAAGSGAKRVPAGVPAQDPQGHRRGPQRGPRAPFISCPSPHLPPLRRWPPLRGALPLRARGIPGIGREGRGVRDPADWGSRPARRRPLRGAEAQAGDGSHTPRAPPSSLGAPPCQTGPGAPPCYAGCREGEFLAIRSRPTTTRPKLLLPGGCARVLRLATEHLGNCSLLP